MDYGEWTGKEDSEVATLWPDVHAAWTAKPHTVRPPEGTTLHEVFNNSFTAMENLAAKHTDQTIAIFAHRVINKVLVIGALSLGLERFPFIIQGNCCINDIERIQSGYLIHYPWPISYHSDNDQPVHRPLGWLPVAAWSQIYCACRLWPLWGQW